jgi:tRNA threonylcarbamoyladenosine biosynthesis protein TsaB
MPVILNIDTSTEIASVSVADNALILSCVLNNVQKEHASFLHFAIKEVLQKTGLTLNQMDAIAVTEGPGSYTGLRVGMATAKGLAYALNKPFITIGTLTAMAKTANIKSDFICPMIDARRMEVYYALYDSNFKEIISPSAIILTDNFLKQELTNNKILFIGSGSLKWKTLINNDNCIYVNDTNISEAIAQLSYSKFMEKDFTELAHCQPLYAKEFYNGI